MSRSMKIAAVAALSGGMIAVALVAVLSEPPARPTPVVAPHTKATDPLEGELARCRLEAEPDAACEAVWDAHRRRFFGDDEAPAPDPVLKITDPLPSDGEDRP